MLLKFAPWKVALIVFALLAGAIMCLPNILPAKYTAWIPTKALNLGLDLKGGASILLEIDPEELRTNQFNINVWHGVRDKLRATPLIPLGADAHKVVGDHLEVRIANPADAEAAAERIRELGKPPLGAIGQSNSYEVKVRTDSVIEVRFTEAAFKKLQTDALASSIEAVRRRVDASGLNEPNVQKQGDNRIIVEVPGQTKTGIEVLTDTLTKAGVLTFNMVDENAVPSEYEVGVERNGRIALPDESLGGKIEIIFTDNVISGGDLAGANQGMDQRNRPNIEFRLNPQGAQRFGRETSQNVGKRFAIVLDNSIVSAPTIQSPIMTGSGEITGAFTVQEAEQLAIVLRSGALPAKLKVASRRVVDASLGADSIRDGVLASVVGISLVALFMIGAYGLLGVFSVVALLCNVFMMIGVLSGLHATLTLPGIAGILLTMGMAVDYNVLIFERIREEQRNGRSAVTAVEAGYEHAMATIIDANVTHLVAALVMFNLGSGPVKGFALTLAIGILTSLFTAVIVARYIMALWLRWTRPKYIPV